MMLPIMAGFQMAISLTELELGNDQILYEKFDGNASNRLEERNYLQVKASELEKIGTSSTPCPSLLDGFTLDYFSDGYCAYMFRDRLPDRGAGRFIFDLGTRSIDVCLISDDSFRKKCSSEVSQS